MDGMRHSNKPNRLSDAGCLNECIFMVLGRMLLYNNVISLLLPADSVKQNHSKNGGPIHSSRKTRQKNCLIY